MTTPAHPDGPVDNEARVLRLGPLTVPIGSSEWLRRASVAGRLGGVGVAILITGIVFQLDESKSGL